MTTQITPESIKEFFEQAAKSYGDAWKSQAQYYEGLIQRNTQCLTDIADARVSSYREMSEAKTFNQAFEANLAFEEKVREELVGLQEANSKSWESLVNELKAVYTPVTEASKAKAPVPKKPKAKAPVAKKTKKAA
jgi:hypothetical protein